MGRSLTEQVAHRRPWRRLALVTTTLVGLVLLAGCSSGQVRELKALGLPESANSSAPYMYELWIGAWIAAGIIGALVWGLIIWVVIRYRRRGREEIPPQVRYHLPLEVLYTVAPFVVIFVLFYHTVVAQDAILRGHDEPDHEVLVIGQQWSWSFNYLGANGRDPQGNVVDDVYEVGTTADEPELVLPVDQTVEFTFRSPDVIHSFWVPAFYFKMDVIPGRTNSWVTTPTKEGVYAGRCAELCGIGHSRMLFTVRVVSQEEYDAHRAELREQGNEGVVLGRTDSDTIAGEEGAGQ